MTSVVDYRKLAWHDAKDVGLDPDTFVRQINQESGFNPNARSGAGAIGIAQILPSTASGWGVDPTDPVAALRAAAKNMRDYVQKYGSERNALIAYNAGPGAVGSSSLPAETQNYIQTILGGSGSGGGLQPVATPSATSTVAPTDTTPTPKAVTPKDLLQTFATMNTAIGSQPWLGAPQNAPQAQTQPATDPYASILDMIKPSAITSTKLATSGSTTQPSSKAQALTDVTGDLKTIKTTYGGVTETLHVSTKIPTVDAASALHLKGLIAFEGVPVAAWIAPALQYAREHGWTGDVNEGYRTDAQQAAIYRSGVRPAAVPKSLGGGGSNHSGDAFPAGAVDASDPQQLANILANSPYAKLLVYAGAKDPVHFSHPHNGSY